MTRVALVTGSYRGIGLEIVRGLCKDFDGIVYLTARSSDRGEEAAQKLRKEGLSPRFHQLDITDDHSIQALKTHLLDTHGGLDVLVNNAGIAFKVADETPFAVQAEESIKTNFFGPLHVSNALLPILRPHGRVINISSDPVRRAMTKCSPAIQSRIRSYSSMTEEELVQLMEEFVRAAKTGTCEENGWPKWGYAISHIGVTLMTFIHAREMEKDPREGILINCADTPVWLALLPENTLEPNGQFMMDRKIKEW
uniref:Carbonyl reductase [NADPH] 1 n=1 Tax=Branchiostoma floridae TaxID=7739 RepID=C3ZGZ6_BRAFL|eukprot:XP_002592132.1 hypothetical protein BRAFLDRAFT_59475 [Branchiostoma floridae]